MSNEAKQPDMMRSEMLSDAAACLKIMAHPVRLQIVDLLIQKELAVHEIAEMCGVKPHQVCEHLRLMQRSGLLSSRRKGRAVYYSVTSPYLPALIHCIRTNCKEKADA